MSPRWRLSSFSFMLLNFHKSHIQLVGDGGIPLFTLEIWCLTSTETIRIIRDGGIRLFRLETRCLTFTETIRIIRDGGIRLFRLETRCLTFTETIRIIRDGGIRLFSLEMLRFVLTFWKTRSSVWCESIALCSCQQLLHNKTTKFLCSC